MVQKRFGRLFDIVVVDQPTGLGPGIYFPLDCMPTAGMSRGETEATVRLIRRIARGKTLVIVEHDMSVVFDLAETISVLVYGRVIATGTPAEIRANRAVKEAYLGSEEP